MPSLTASMAVSFFSTQKNITTFILPHFLQNFQS